MADSDPDPLATWLAVQRPDLFRYCARMTGSIADGEDAVQDTLVKALLHFPGFDALADPRAWLFRVAHNSALDILRARSRSADPLTDEIGDAAVDPVASSESAWVTTAALRHFMWLTPTERSCVVLMDVLGYTLQEIADMLGKTAAAVKSSLHRGRSRLKEIAGSAEQPPIPSLGAADEMLLSLYAERFNARDFEGVRALLSEEVQLDLVGRAKLYGKTAVGGYVSRYASTQDWRFVPGVIEGRPALVVIDPRDAELPPMYFIFIDFVAGKIARIRDFRYARYACASVIWAETLPASTGLN